MPNKIERLSIKEIIERFRSTSTEVGKAYNNQPSKKIEVTRNLVRDRIAKIESGDNQPVQEPKKSIYPITTYRKATIEADIVKSRVLHFMRAKSVQDEPLPTVKRYSLPAIKNNGILSLKSQFENSAEDSERAKTEEEMTFIRNGENIEDEIVLSDREEMIKVDIIDNNKDIFDDEENSAQTECCCEGHCGTTSYDKISENEQWPFPTGEADSDLGIFIDIDAEEEFEEIFRRYSIEDGIDDGGDETFQQNEDETLVHALYNSTDAEVVNATHAEGDNQISQNKFRKSETLNQNFTSIPDKLGHLDIYDEVLDQNTTHFYEDKTYTIIISENGGLQRSSTTIKELDHNITSNHNQANVNNSTTTEILHQEPTRTLDQLNENLFTVGCHEIDEDTKIAEGLDDNITSTDLEQVTANHSPTSETLIQNKKGILDQLEGNPDSSQNVLDRNIIDYKTREELDRNIISIIRNPSTINKSSTNETLNQYDWSILAQSQEHLNIIDEVLDQILINLFQNRETENLEPITPNAEDEDLTEEAVKESLEFQTNNIELDPNITSKIRNPSSINRSSTNETLNQCDRSILDQSQEHVDIINEVLDHILTNLFQNSETENLQSTTPNLEDQDLIEEGVKELLEIQTNDIDDNLNNTKKSVMEIIKMFEEHHPSINRRRSLIETLPEKYPNFHNEKIRRYSSYTKPILSEDKSQVVEPVLYIDELDGENLEPSQSSVKKLKMIFEERNSRKSKEYKNIEELKNKLVHNETIAYAPKILDDVALEGNMELEIQRLAEFYRETLETVADPIFLIVSLYCSVSLVVNFIKLFIYIFSKIFIVAKM